MSGSWLLRVAVLLVGFGVFLQAYVGDLRAARYQDFGALYDAAGVLSRGDTDALYAHDAVDFAHAARGSTRRPFVQPPIVAEAARLALPLGMERAGRTLAVVGLLAVLAACALLARAMGYDARSPPLATAGAALAGLALFEPLRLAVSSGQTTPIAFLGIVLALEAPDDRVAGGGLALASVVKGSPLLVAVVFIAQRRWRALVWTAAALGVVGLASVATCGLPAHLAFARTLQWMSGAGITGFVNQSLTAFLLRQELPFRESFSLLIHPLSPAWRSCVAVITVAAAAGAVVAYPRLQADRRDALLKSFVVLLVLLAPTVSWSHYYLFALVPLAHLATCARGDRGAWVALGVAAGLMLRPLAPTTDPPDPSANFFASGFVLAACVLVALTGALAWQARVRRA